MQIIVFFSCILFEFFHIKQGCVCVLGAIGLSGGTWLIVSGINNKLAGYLVEN